MAYFSNGTDGEVLDYQCTKCKYGEQPCPIYWVQVDNNYDACNNPVAKQILDHLIKQDGTCTMFEMFKQDFATDGSRQAPLFPELIPKIENIEP